MMMRIILILIIVLAASYVSASEVVLKTPFLKAELQGGLMTELSVDYTGKGKFGTPVFRDFSVGMGTSGKLLSSDSGKAVFSVITNKFETDGRFNFNCPIRLEKGSTLAVLFESPENLVQVAIKMPTYYETKSGATLTLYEAKRINGGYSKGRQVATKPIRNHKDNEWATLDFRPRPVGFYVIEATDPIGLIGIWGDMATASEGDSFLNGKPLTQSLNYRITVRKQSEGVVKYTAEGRKLAVEYSGDAFPGTVFYTDWQRNGYDLSPSPFDACYTSYGQWIYFNQLKRRPFSTAMLPCCNLVLRAYDKYNLNVEFGTGGKYDWFSHSRGLQWKGGALKTTFTVISAAKLLPEWAPVFECSDAKLGKLSTEFYLSHGANFGPLTNPDWKEWQGRILSFTSQETNDFVRNQLLNIRMTPEGYVYTWDDSIGWPFPYLDKDDDGVNDYDTRHFTTNSCYILGVWHYMGWKRDRAFVESTLARVRKAMDYQLEQLQGSTGLLITNSEWHTGKSEALGANYWDILPFGHKDAFSNIYFCASLKAMAQIEKMADLLKITAEGTRRSPDKYLKLFETARKAFNTTFWDENQERYVGCVDIDGKRHDYGFTFINIEAASVGIPDKRQAGLIFKWLQSGMSSSGKADIYSRWIFAPRSLTIHNPYANEPNNSRPRWWFMGWPVIFGRQDADYDAQCQNGGAILYVSFYDLMARDHYLGPDNAVKRYREILDRYDKPDRLSGGSPLWRGEVSQGGPGGGPGSVGVEGEFPESGLVPCYFLYGLMGVSVTAEGIQIKPSLPSGISWARCRNLFFNGLHYTVHVTRHQAVITRQDTGKKIILPLKSGFAVFNPSELWRGK